MAVENLFDGVAARNASGRAAPGETKTVQCEECGVAIRRFASQIRRKNFCSRPCADAHGLITVRCRWPGCSETMLARQFVRRARGKAPAIEFKTNLVKRGAATRHPICDGHRSLVSQHLGERTKWTNGQSVWFDDPGRDLGSRGVIAKLTRLIIFAKSAGCCASCGVGLQFDGPPKSWQIDHIKPVFQDGLTTYHNLAALCEACHDRKSAGEKSLVARARHAESKLGRWLTHREKDELIRALRAEVKDLRRRLADREDVPC